MEELRYEVRLLLRSIARILTCLSVHLCESIWIPTTAAVLAAAVQVVANEPETTMCRLRLLFLLRAVSTPSDAKIGAKVNLLFSSRIVTTTNVRPGR